MWQNLPAGQVKGPFKATAHLSKAETFHVSDEFALPGWALDVLNNERTPITLDPLALNEARLACREAMTLITEEAARLVNHPDLAYADYDPNTMQTRMKRPTYPYPEVLRNRLPVFVHNDAGKTKKTLPCFGTLSRKGV